MTIADEAIDLMQARGGAAYFAEPVSQLEHALRTAHCAAQAGSPPELVVRVAAGDYLHHQRRTV
jgi:predicted HD phosphohydrolase